MQDILVDNNKFHLLTFSTTEKEINLSEVRIVLLGGEGVGKSTSGNMIMQRSFF